jgi:hypothetical protein
VGKSEIRISCCEGTKKKQGLILLSRLRENKLCGTMALTHPYVASNKKIKSSACQSTDYWTQTTKNYKALTIKERLLALVRDLFTFSSKVIKMFILV